MKPIRTYLPLLVLVAGCATTPTPPPVPTPADATFSWYQDVARTQQVLRIDTARSLITVTVRRGGTFARMGHDHVIASRSIEGFVAPDAGRADFRFRLDQMTVDETALRTQAGLTTQPDDDAIAGTRTNMLTRVLEAERYPLVTLHAERAAGKGDTLRLSVNLHGVSRTVEVPTTIERSNDGVTASGTLTLLQSDFGITPMSVMGGALTVQDPMELAFSIVATPLPR
ncbi:YceI family protein [Massilia pseudoviolaceinigra]|uniref:YceI family protein n=1 Tax=Massilia pseudoviolaceinigra TaxID=3057165 RepID=UPI002796A0A2|nr:YceI family protein [Massilia sp. CCM 9206]MDQ1921726.1 YceI family protein [Massilia sp. CCM 9206]